MGSIIATGTYERKTVKTEPLIQFIIPASIRGQSDFEIDDEQNAVFSVDDNGLVTYGEVILAGAVATDTAYNDIALNAMKAAWLAPTFTPFVASDFEGQTYFIAWADTGAGTVNVSQEVYTATTSSVTDILPSGNSFVANTAISNGLLSWEDGTQSFIARMPITSLPTGAVFAGCFIDAPSATATDFLCSRERVTAATTQPVSMYFTNQTDAVNYANARNADPALDM
jgi:hypothetical protein